VAVVVVMMPLTMAHQEPVDLAVVAQATPEQQQDVQEQIQETA
jgi:hypothetical protein